ncbi:unnamed protein product [Medioppia subpectinata]|uniref:Uncharacterized protein n=1 Tax=Medioppia subpectinata TaxID=1979941 RepID=A0A7R9L1G9_9ACAR|nr:unnamed protein product [Medioppia subpectinata]CAG2113738.1 unnamed protein product [Medioppia subpectinata]
MSSLSEESDQKCRELCEEMSALKASNESEVKALKAQLKSAMDSMQTMETQIKDLKQNLLNYNKSLNEMSIKNSELSEELSALKTSKHIIESDVKQMDKEINAQNIRSPVSDNSSSIGSHNQLTTNSDKIRDDINIDHKITEIQNQMKYNNKMTNNLYNYLFGENNSIKAFKEIVKMLESSADLSCAFNAFTSDSLLAFRADISSHNSRHFRSDSSLRL